MEQITIALGALIVLCGVLHVGVQQTATHEPYDAAFYKFQWVYIIPYLLAAAGDWLQGPYMYALYVTYGISTSDIEILFVAGFGSSMLVGTFVGSFADKYGRKANSILYGIVYGASCITKHFNSFWILMVGRVLGGIATSILYSSFESWLIHRHTELGFPSASLGAIFSNAVVGNSLVAAGCGTIAQVIADRFGQVYTFDAALSCLILMSVVISCTWTENYGNVDTSITDLMKKAWQTMVKDRVVVCLGLVQSLFEGAMYTFVLEWTPALREAAPETSLGNAFSSFMVSVMIGSTIFKYLIDRWSPESFMRPVLVISSLCMLVPIFAPKNFPAVYASCLVFEGTIGLFWPAMSTMRGKYVPEESRATLMNCFRVPLNLIVVVVLLQHVPRATLFGWCSALLFASALCQTWLHRRINSISAVAAVAESQ